ncbi:MAG: hypothetical protein KAX40_11100 [Herpetosiphon sp.]|nr:hypothetical protein [Herpetosiphon sp.]
MRKQSMDCDDVMLDRLFRDVLHDELDRAKPNPQAIKGYRPIDVPERRIRGGGPGGTPCSGFYLLYYVLNSSRPAWSSIPG